MRQYAWRLIATFAALLVLSLPGHTAAPQPVTIFVCGDVLLGQRTRALVNRPDCPIQQLAAEIRSSDIAFCNLECTLTTRRAGHGIPPQLYAPPSDVAVLKSAGFDIVSMANNHAMDDGERGVLRTLTDLNRAGIAAVGARDNSQPWRAWETTVRGRKIAWLAASAYGKFADSAASIRPIADSGLIEQVRALSRRETVLVSLHWGVEYNPNQTQGQIATAHALINAGASAVIGHHPHVAQPVEVYRGRPIFYSLGNFLFDQNPAHAQSGLAAVLTIDPRGDVGYRTIALPMRALETSPRVRRGERVMKTVSGHFTAGDSGKQWVVWSRRADGMDMLRAYTREDAGWKCIATGHHPSIYDLQAGDIDHNGVDEIVVGLFQRSKLDVRVLRRIHIYGVDAGRGFRPRWRGSTLVRPFRRFLLLPSQGGCDLAAIEHNPLPEYKNFEWLSVYRWSDFGVHLVWDAPIRGKIGAFETGTDAMGPFIRVRQLVKGKKARTLLFRRVGDEEFRAKIVDGEGKSF